MKNVGIVTDTTACIPTELVSRYGIEVVPVTLIIGGKTFRDGVDLSPSEFYARLREAKNPPTNTMV